MLRILSLSLILLLSVVAARADVVVNYDALGRSNDRELRNERDRRQVIAELDRHFERLGNRYLGRGQDLHVRIIRLDLAGQYEPWRMGLQDVRILRDVTPPRIRLSYTLLMDGKPLRSGEATLSDMNYLSDPRAVGDSDRFIHEKLLLDDWFRHGFKS